MVTLVFNAIDVENNYCEFSYTNASFGVCLDQLTFLVDYGWKLLTVKCLYKGGTYFFLPIEAFDGALFGPTLNQLEYEWEKLLLPA